MRSMWNRWTSKAIVLALAAMCALAVPPVQFVDYAWLTLHGGHHSLNATLPAGTDWDAAAIVAPVAPFGEPAPGLLTLVSGDALPGTLARCTDGPNGLVFEWESARLGTYRVSTDEIATIQLALTHDHSAVFELRNGDTLDVLPQLGARGPSISGAVIPWERVAAIRFRTPAVTTQGTRLWLRNGGILTVATTETRTGGFFARTPDGRAGMFDAGEVLAITHGPYRVRPIGRPALRDDTLEHDGQSLTARGHGVARWELSGREIAIIGSAQTPEASVEWADALVSVWTGSDLVFSSRTRKERPAIAIGSASIVNRKHSRCRSSPAPRARPTV